MAENSRIEWTDHTFNPWWGCTKVSPACDNCYAEAWAKRTGHSVWGAKAERRFLSELTWRQPVKWNAAASRCGKRARVFCASMADVFEWRPDLNEARNKLWNLIECTPSLDWLLLTKRPHLASRLVPWTEAWPHNVWIGTTAENQKLANKRIPKLLELPARIRFLSCEPLLDSLDIGRWLKHESIHWVIAGGESGPNARPTNPDWFRNLRDQCKRYRVAFHFKQWGDWAPNDAVSTDHIPATVIRHPEWSISLARYGKKLSGRMLDGVVWGELPKNPSGSKRLLVAR